MNFINENLHKIIYELKSIKTEKDYIELSKNFTQERDKLINEKEELLKLSTNLKNDNNNKEEIEKAHFSIEYTAKEMKDIFI